MDSFFIPVIVIYGIFIVVYLGVAFFVARQAKRYAYLGDKTNLVLSLFWAIVAVILVLTSFFCWSLDWSTVPSLLEYLSL